jgi:lysozyme
MSLKVQLIREEEGFRSEAYCCTEGYPTIGTGHKIGPKGAPLSAYTFTVSKEVDEVWTLEGIDKIDRQLSKKYDWYQLLNEDRQAVIVSMCYQLGIDGFGKFKKTIEHISNGDYKDAAKEMLDSKWAVQTEGRAVRHSVAFERGDLSIVGRYSRFVD